MTEQPEGNQEIAVEVDLTGGDLTLNERIEVENACGGAAFEQLQADGRSTFFRAVAWVVGRRSNPRLTLHEAGELKVRFDGG